MNKAYLLRVDYLAYFMLITLLDTYLIDCLTYLALTTRFTSMSSQLCRSSKRASHRVGPLLRLNRKLPGNQKHLPQLQTKNPVRTVDHT